MTRIIPPTQRDHSSDSFPVLLGEYRRQAQPTRKELDWRVKAPHGMSGITQGELAERSGYSKGFIGNLEAGLQEPSPEAIRRIAKALDIPASKFNATCRHCGEKIQ